MQRFTGRQYLQIDIANNFGLDKKTWEERLAWFEEHKDHLIEMLPLADEPALFYAGVRAYEDVLDGKPIGYPVGFDATSSGLQLLAVLTGDRLAAELCNVVNHEGRADAYTIIYGKMLEVLGEGAKIKRDDTKRAIMTSLYGSQAVPKEVFGEGILLQTFLNVMQENAPAAWELNEAFLEMWDGDALSNDWVLPDNFHVRVKVMSPTSETVHFFNEPIEIFRQVNAPMKEGRSLGANTIHSVDGMIVRELTRRCDYDLNAFSLVQEALIREDVFRFEDPRERKHALDMTQLLWGHYQKSSYLSARILDYIDSGTLCWVNKAVIQELLDSMPIKPFKVISVHDCFRCLPQYMNDLRTQYNRQLYLISRSKMLSFLLSQLMKRDVNIEKLDPELHEHILESDYALS